VRFYFLALPPCRPLPLREPKTAKRSDSKRRYLKKWPQKSSTCFEGPPKKKKKENKDQKNNPKKQPTDFPFLFVKGAPCVGCGHATACGHPQLAAGSSFAS
jgi:hypothetical protein